MAINKRNLIGKMENSINKLETLWVPANLVVQFDRLKSLKEKIEMFDEKEDADIIKIISDKFTDLVNEITQWVIKSFNDFATTSVNEIKQATGWTGRPVSSFSSSESSGRVVSSGESSGYRSSESNSVRTSSSESNSRRSSESSGRISSSGESGGYRWGSSSM